MEGYEVRDENGRKVGGEILIQFYGNVWESTLNRLHHKSDGHLLTIHYNGNQFRIYRKPNLNQKK